MRPRDRGLVFVFSRWYYPSVGGTQTVVREVCENLVAEGFRVRLFTPGRSIVLDRIVPFRVTRIPDWAPLGLEWPLLSWWRGQDRLEQVLGQCIELPVACHVFDAVFGRVPVNWARQHSIRTTITLTGFDLPGGKNPRSIGRRLVARKTIRMADRVTAPSRLFAEQARQALGIQNVEVVPHGIRHHPPRGATRDSIRRSLGLDAGAFAFAAIQRMFPGKAPLNAIRAFRATDFGDQDAALVIVGTGPEEAKARRLADGDPRIRFVQAIPQERVADYLRASDAFVIDSAYESFGLAALEAMAASLPIVATHAGALDELLVDGETALLSAYGDVQALASHMGALASDPALRARLGDTARERSKGFDWSEVVPRYVTGYGAA